MRLYYVLCWTGMSLSAGSSPLHSPKITPHTSPAPRRRSHTPNPNPNPANYMVPTTAPDQAGGAHIIQKETVGGTTYFYTDNTPAPLAGMVWFMLIRDCCYSFYMIYLNISILISRCSRHITCIRKQHLMWRTCNQKPMRHPFSWLMNFDR